MGLIEPDFVNLGPQQLVYRRGDTLPGIVIELLDDRGAAINLTDTTCWLSTRRVSGIPHHGNEWGPPRQVLIVDAENGVIYYDVQRADTDVPPGEFELAVVISEAGLEVSVPTQPKGAKLVIRDRAENVWLGWDGGSIAEQGSDGWSGGTAAVQGVNKIEFGSAASWE